MFGIHVLVSSAKMGGDFVDEQPLLTGCCYVQCLLDHVVTILVFHQGQYVAMEMR